MLVLQDAMCADRASVSSPSANSKNLWHDRATFNSRASCSTCSGFSASCQDRRHAECHAQSVRGVATREEKAYDRTPQMMPLIGSVFSTETIIHNPCFERRGTLSPTTRHHARNGRPGRQWDDKPPKAPDLPPLYLGCTDCGLQWSMSMWSPL